MDSTSRMARSRSSSKGCASGSRRNRRTALAGWFWDWSKASGDAMPRYEALAKTTTDDYRRTVYRMEAAELKVKLSRAKEGIADLEQLLAKLNPESWLFREVRRKIEDVFLKTDDQDGLAKYYAAWLASNPEDIEAMARLARVLARQARVPEAEEWLNKALKLAPSG